MAALIDWWRIRSPREQFLLGLMLVLLLGLLVWLLILRPLDRAIEDARTRHEAAVTRLGEARRRAALFEGAQAQDRPVPPRPVDAFLLRTAREAGFEPRITTAGPDQAALVLAAVRPQPFFAWTALMERRGVMVREMRARANPDRTLSVEVAFSARPE